MQQLLQIKQLKSVGFTLKDISYLQLLSKHELIDCENVGKVVDDRIQTISEKIIELQLLEKKLHSLRNACAGNCLSTLNNF